LPHSDWYGDFPSYTPNTASHGSQLTLSASQVINLLGIPQRSGVLRLPSIQNMEQIIVSVAKSMPSYHDLFGILKQFHTGKASLLAEALKRHLITHQQYFDVTFSIMVEIFSETKPLLTIKRPVVVSIYEDTQSLSLDVRRMFEIDDIALLAIRANFFHPICPSECTVISDRTADVEAILRFMKMRAEYDRISFHFA